MLKNLSVAAILLAAAIANASDLTSATTSAPAPEVEQFDKATIKNTRSNATVRNSPLKRAKEDKESSSSSSSDSSSDSSSSTDSSTSSSSSDSSDSSSSSSTSSSTSSSNSSSSSDSDSDSSSSSSSSSSTDSDSSSTDEDKKTKKSKAIKKFSKSHGKKMLKSGKEKDVVLKRYKSKVDKKGKKHKHAKRSKHSSVKNALKFKSKKAVMVTVDDNNLKGGVVVSDNGTKLFKTPKSTYAIVEKGSHKITIAANKSGKKGKASIKVQQVKLSKKIAKKYKIVANTVQYKDAQELCERFGGQLAEVSEKDIKKIVKAAEKLVKKGIDSLWIDRVVTKTKDEVNTYLPTVLNLTTSKAIDDPEEQYAKITIFANKQIEAIKYNKSSQKSKYKKALAKAEAKIRKYSDKYLDKRDKSTPRAVLCRFH